MVTRPRRRVPWKVSRQFKEFQRQLHSIGEAQAKNGAEFQRWLLPLAEAQAKIGAEFQQHLRAIAEAGAKIEAEFQRWLRPIAEAQAKTAAEFQHPLHPIAEAQAKVEASGREMVRQQNEVVERILDEEAKHRGVSRGRALEMALLVELRGWNHRTLREVLRSHRRPGKRKGGQVTDAVMFAEVDEVRAKNRKLSLTAATKKVAERHGASAQGLYKRYRKRL